MSNEAITYTLLGDPIPLARPRHGAHKVYDSQKNEKLVHSINLRNQHNDRPFYEGPLLLSVFFFMPIPPSRSKQKDKLINTFHVYTPDLSNMIKFVEDIANGILYKDDCQISSIVAHKIYSDTSRTEFTLSRIDK